MGRCVNDVFDFYKPVGGISSEYPAVDGHLSVRTYLNALDECYRNFQHWHTKITQKKPTVKDFHSVLFHAPFCKIVQKAMARLVYTDMTKENGLINGSSSALASALTEEMRDKFNELKSIPTEKTYMDRDFNKFSMELSQDVFDQKVSPYMEFNRRLGNMYTASLYAQLIDLVAISSQECLVNKRILMYSYGGGYYQKMVKSAKSACQRLDQRNKCSPEQYSQSMKSREDLIKAGSPYVPVHASNGLKMDLFANTYYLANIDKSFVREYKRHF
uniref:Hydroxymethylglutaryl-coenzyme A synthase C-terminal domain-containing protein n=1 Tax=Ditylenchus dipsaci TaxID=166011 RepID=A0A915DBP9_9BILA